MDGRVPSLQLTAMLQWCHTQFTTIHRTWIIRAHKVLRKKWFHDHYSRANSTNGASIFRVITSSYSFYLRGEVDATQHRKEGCDVRKLNTRVVSYKGHKRIVDKESSSLLRKLAVKEGASVERNNVRMSYIYSRKDFVLCSSLPIATISIRVS